MKDDVSDNNFHFLFLAFAAYCLCSFPGNPAYRVGPTDLDQQPPSDLPAPAIARHIDALANRYDWANTDTHPIAAGTANNIC
jgi:hypothetical protein